MKVKRVICFLDDDILVKSDLGVLLKFGIEVYTPKINEFEKKYNFDYLKTVLTIPKESETILDETNFYLRDIPSKTWNIVNQYFDMCIMGLNTNLIRNLSNNFAGIICYREYGKYKYETFTDYIVNNLGIGYLKKIETLGKRFIYLKTEEELGKRECGAVLANEFYCPIAFGNDQYSDSWEGNEKRFLFECSEIATDENKRKFYEKFSKHFFDSEYYVIGEQFVDVENDDRVIDCFQNEHYYELLKHSKALLYRWNRDTEIDYYILKAINVGIPIVFVGDSFLGNRYGQKKVGFYKKYKDAERAIKNIFSDKERFINKIKAYQKKILTDYSEKKCEEKWKQFFDLLDGVKLNKETTGRQIAIIVPAEYTGGVLDYALRLTKAIVKGAEIEKEDIRVVFAYLEHENYDDEEFSNELKTLGVKTRQFQWEEIEISKAIETLDMLRLDVNLYDYYEQDEKIVIPNDGMNYFLDCDYLLFVADRVPGELFSLIPYGLISHDYIQRYLPKMLGKYYEKNVIDVTRGADAIFTTTKTTKDDCINYVGISEEKIHLLPLFFDDIDYYKQGNELHDEEYFVWSTNISPHKNHLTVLKALELYYENGGNLECYMTGALTEKLDINEQFVIKDEEEPTDQELYVKKVRDTIKKSSFLKKHIIVMGCMPKQRYYSVLSQAKFFLHAGYADNGNGTTFDAALLGVPTLSSEYPAMVNIDRVIGINMKFFPVFDYHKLCDCIEYMEENEIELPPREELLKHTIKDPNLCLKMYTVIHENGAI